MRVTPDFQNIRTSGDDIRLIARLETVIHCVSVMSSSSSESLSYASIRPDSLNEEQFEGKSGEYLGPVLLTLDIAGHFLRML